MAALRPSAAVTPVSASVALERLAGLCRLAESGAKHDALATGHEELDRLLPRGGWPLGALIELLSATRGIGELSLFLPALCRLAQGGRYIVWVAPPYVPYAPALSQRGLPLEQLLIIQAHTLQESLWVSEQALRCPAVGAVLGWPDHLVDRNLRRLQLAAEAGGSLGILHRPAEASVGPSPAAVRLQLQPLNDGMGVHILKARGGRGGSKWHWRSAGLDDVVVHSSADAGT